jgi:hypothetical protein
MHPWTMNTKLTEQANNGATAAIKLAATVLGYEFQRLAKQKCAYCDGIGHSGNDCPTDRKVSQMRGGIKEQNTILQLIRKQCRVDAGMGNVKGFSLISADPNKTRLGKRIRSGSFDTQSADNVHSRKRIRFN